jgi:hypothetical protein
MAFMKIPRIKFVLFFLVLSFVFLFSITELLDQAPESFVGTESQGAWRSTISTILSPIKVALVGPVLPFIKFLHQDPDTPPPFFLAVFAGYWIILAVFLHFILTKIRRAKPKKVE